MSNINFLIQKTPALFIMNKNAYQLWVFNIKLKGLSFNYFI